MKEIEVKQKDKLEISIKQKKQVEKKLIGDIIPHNGHKIYKINKETLEIEEAKYINTTYNISGENKKEIIVIDGFEYVSALNKKNALKLFAKGKVGGKEIIEQPLYIKIY
jgi:hypothetical protein